MEENGTKKTNSAMETTTLTRVPESERRPWWSLAFIWAGSVICIPALMVGSMVMAGIVVYCLGASIIKNEKINPIYAMNLKLTQTAEKE